MAYQAVKNPNGSGWLIDDGVTGRSIRYPTKAKATAAIARYELCRIEGIVIAAERKAARTEAVMIYLAVRATRKVTNQLELDF